MNYIPGLPEYFLKSYCGWNFLVISLFASSLSVHTEAIDFKFHFIPCYLAVKVFWWSLWIFLSIGSDFLQLNADLLRGWVCGEVISVSKAKMSKLDLKDGRSVGTQCQIQQKVKRPLRVLDS